MKVFHSLALLAGMADLMAASPTSYPTMSEHLYKRAPLMVFNCADMPEVCNNMCWGAYCTRTPSFSTTLFFDQASAETRRDRRTAAGCLPSPNRCSVRHDPPFPQAEFSCDEFPFASTREAQNGGQVNRCVPAVENRRQGGTIARYYTQVCQGAPCQFSIGFSDTTAPGVIWCDAFLDPPQKCIPDDNIFKGANPDVRPQNVLQPIILPDPGLVPPQPVTTELGPPLSLPGDEAKTPSDPISTFKEKRDLEKRAVGGMYKTEGGITITSPTELAPGTEINRVVLKANGDPGAPPAAGPEDGDEDDEVLSDDFEIIADKIAFKLA